jgi:hypothetical protein
LFQDVVHKARCDDRSLFSIETGSRSWFREREREFLGGFSLLYTYNTLSKRSASSDSSGASGNPYTIYRSGIYSLDYEGSDGGDALYANTGTLSTTSSTGTTSFSAPVYSVVTLVRVVKSMRELSCKSFARELDVEIVGRWLPYSIIHYGTYLGGGGFESELCHSFTSRQSTILVGYIAI